MGNLRFTSVGLITLVTRPSSVLSVQQMARQTGWRLRGLRQMQPVILKVGWLVASLAIIGCALIEAAMGSTRPIPTSPARQRQNVILLHPLYHLLFALMQIPLAPPAWTLL